MPGYMSFLVVFLAVLLLFSAIRVLDSARALDLSRPISAERAYGLLLNAKECALEAARQGAAAGFSDYDSSHEMEKCRHCADHLCIPPTPPNPRPPNVCSDALCMMCFRESEARTAAEYGVVAGLARLQGQGFDDDFNVSFAQMQPADFDIFLILDGSGENGLGVGSVRFAAKLPVRVRSDKLGVLLSGSIPAGVVVGYGPYDG